MTALANYRTSFFAPNFVAPFGESASARYIDECLTSLLVHWDDTAGNRARLEGLEQEIFELRSECAVAGWDGYSARPVTPMTIFEASKFLAALPKRLLPDDVSPEHHGGVGFLWEGGDGSSLVISLNGTQTLEYAAIYGAVDQDVGRRAFTGLLSPFVLDLISSQRALVQ